MCVVEREFLVHFFFCRGIKKKGTRPQSFVFCWHEKLGQSIQVWSWLLLWTRHSFNRPWVVLFVVLLRSSFLRSIAVVIHHFFFHVASATRCADHASSVACVSIHQFTITFLTEEELFFVLCSVYVHTHINWTGWPRPRLISTPTKVHHHHVCATATCWIWIVWFHTYLHHHHVSATAVVFVAFGF